MGDGVVFSRPLLRDDEVTAAFPSRNRVTSLMPNRSRRLTLSLAADLSDAEYFVRCHRHTFRRGGGKPATEIKLVLGKGESIQRNFSSPPLATDGDKICKRSLCNTWKKRNECPN